jgi:hypothetical protein
VADPNRALFESVVRLLAPVLDELVLVGGCTTGLFITDPAATGIRPTKDVDAIVDVTSYAKYAALADNLRAIGLVEDATEGAPLCRWRYGALIVDVMPTDAAVLGFSNRWYPEAIDTATTIGIAGRPVRLVTPALFIATKLEAFRGRGGADVFASQDLEDMIAVVDSRPEIVSEVTPQRRSACASTLPERSRRSSTIPTSSRRCPVSSYQTRPVRRGVRFSRIDFDGCETGACPITVSELCHITPETPVKHDHLRAHAGAHRCCGSR